MQHRFFIAVLFGTYSTQDCTILHWKSHSRQRMSSVYWSQNFSHAQPPCGSLCVLTAIYNILALRCHRAICCHSNMTYNLLFELLSMHLATSFCPRPWISPMIRIERTHPNPKFWTDVVDKLSLNDAYIAHCRTEDATVLARLAQHLLIQGVLCISTWLSETCIVLRN